MKGNNNMKKLTVLFLILGAFGFCSFSAIGENSVIQKAQAVEYTQVRAYHILVNTEKEAQTLRTAILNTTDRATIYENFKQAARMYSKCPSASAGGDLGWFSKGDMVPEFEKVAFSLPNGEVSQPVKTQFGWHLIYVSAKK